MTLVVEKDEPFDPMNVALLGLWTLVSRADRLTDFIEQLRSRSGWNRLNASFEIHPPVNDYKRDSRFVSVCCFHIALINLHSIATAFSGDLFAISFLASRHTAPAGPANSVQTCRSNVPGDARCRR
jgi:hypothetical protein